MQECASTGKSSIVKRVTVRSGGAGHAHSKIAKGVSADSRSGDGDAATSERAETKVVRLRS
jgi:hypothetical protein